MNKFKENNPQPYVLEDASQANWVDQYSPLWLNPFLKLSRWDRPIGTWLLMIPCFWGLGFAIISNDAKFSLTNVWLYLAFFLGSILMRGAGCTWNDINDRKFDSLVKRTMFRPIPSGQISVRHAIIWMIAQVFVSFLILLTFNNYAILVGIIALIPLFIYPYAKRFTWWPQIFLGIAFNWGVLLAYSAQTGRIDLPAVILYFSGIFWTLYYDTIYAHQDAEDDALIGVKSTARLFGKNSKKWLLCFIAICGILMELSFYLALNSKPKEFIIVSTLSIIAFALHLLNQLRTLDINNSASCLSLFKSNKRSGLIIVFSLLLQLFLIKGFYS